MTPEEVEQLTLANARRKVAKLLRKRSEDHVAYERKLNVMRRILADFLLRLSPISGNCEGYNMQTCSYRLVERAQAALVGDLDESEDPS